MYLMLFLVGLPGQFFFGVASMTLSAVLTTYLFGLLYFAATGTYFFYDSYVPIAVFLGMHLLFTDPSTSPRTELGRVIFGAALRAERGRPVSTARRRRRADLLRQAPAGAGPEPLGQAAGSRGALDDGSRPFDPARLGRSLAPRQRHVAYLSVWAVVFALMSAAQGVGDRHPGQWLPFWDRACQEGRPRACAYLANLQSIYCNAGSGWACNETGRSSARTLTPSGRAPIAADVGQMTAGVRARMQARVRAGVPQRPARGKRNPAVRAGAADARRLPDRPARQQGTDHRPHTVGAATRAPASRAGPTRAARHQSCPE